MGISVVIPLFGRDKYREQLFEFERACIAKQHYAKIELLAVEQYIDKPLWCQSEFPTYAKHIAIKDGTQFCLSWCMNVGAREARYDKLLLTGADMVFDTGYFEKIDEFLTQYPCGVGFNRLVYMSKLGTADYIKTGYQAELKPECVEKVVRPHVWTAGGVTVHRKDVFFDTLGGMNENYFAYGKDDKDLYLRMKQVYRPFKMVDYEIRHLYHKARIPRPPENEDTYNLVRHDPAAVSKKLVEAGMGKRESRTIIQI